MAKGWNTSPALIYSGVDEHGLHATVTVAFNTNTLAIINPGATITREPGCSLDVLVVGIDLTRTNRSEFPVPEGSTDVSRGALNAVGFQTVQDIAEAGISFRRSV